MPSVSIAYAITLQRRESRRLLKVTRSDSGRHGLSGAKAGRLAQWPSRRARFWRQKNRTVKVTRPRPAGRTARMQVLPGDEQTAPEQTRAVSGEARADGGKQRACPECAATADASARFCPACGEGLPPLAPLARTCPDCSGKRRQHGTVLRSSAEHRVRGEPVAESVSISELQSASSRTRALRGGRRKAAATEMRKDEYDLQRRAECSGRP